jgi:predicted naringenin-chalcone synthase
MGCHAAINGLRIAKSIAESDPDARVLLCAVELCTLHQQYGWHPERVVSNALFGDGAAAVVGLGGTQTDDDGPAVIATGSTIVPDTAEHMSWQVRDHGFEMRLSAQVPGIIETSLRGWLTDWLNDQQLDIQDVRGWAIHPGGPKIVRACAEALQLGQQDIEAAQNVLAEFGNMSSPTVLFILERLIQSGQCSPCVMLAFGPGLSIEAALIR